MLQLKVCDKPRCVLWAIPKLEDILRPTHEISNNTFTKYKIISCVTFTYPETNSK